MEASRNEAVLEQELESALAVVLEGLEWEEGSALVVLVVLVLAQVVVEDHQWASHTCHPCTSFLIHIANRDCISSRTDDRGCRTAHDRHVCQLESLMGTQHLKIDR
jgi:hypothetical protein